MPRHLFPGDLHQLANGLPAANSPFTLWSDDASGVSYTDVLARDGVSPAELVTSPDGLRPYLYGPNDVEVMYVDTGVGIRFPVYADDVLRTTLDETTAAAIADAVSMARQALQRLDALPASSGATPLDLEAVRDEVNAMIEVGTGLTKFYDDNGTGNIRFTATGAQPTLATMPPRYTHSIPYATAAAATTRAAAIAASQGGSTAGSTRTDIIVRIYGGSLSDVDPTWMLDDDFRHIYAAA